MSALSPEVRELLELMRDALDLPYGATVEDENKRQTLRGENATRVVAHLNLVLTNEARIPAAVRVLRESLADNPVDYAIEDGQADR